MTPDLIPPTATRTTAATTTATATATTAFLSRIGTLERADPRQEAGGVAGRLLVAS